MVPRGRVRRKKYDETVETPRRGVSTCPCQEFDVPRVTQELHLVCNLFSLSVFLPTGAETKKIQEGRGKLTLTLNGTTIVGEQYEGEKKMKRTTIVAAAALVIAGMAAPSFAHVTKRKHMHKKPAAARTITKKDETKALETKSTEAVAKTPAVTETKPLAAAPSKPGASETMTNKAVDTAKDKATDVAKEKTANAVTGGAKPVVNSTPSVPSVNPSAAATKAATSTMPATPSVTAPVAK